MSRTGILSKINWAVLRPISQTILKEFGITLAILFIIAFCVFLLVFYSPNEDMLYEYMMMITEQSQTYSNIDINQLGLIKAFSIWIGAVLTGNFGLSISNGMPAMEQSAEFLAKSVYLIFFSVMVSLLIALPLTAMIVRQNTQIIQKSLSGMFTSLSFLPLFWLAYAVIYVSGHYFDYFPLVQDIDNTENAQYLLPVLLLALGSGLIIEIAHQLSHEISRVSAEDYILCARAKGASVFKHIFKEGIAFPLLTILSNRIAYLFGATIIIEQIFNWPGIGKLLWQATQNRDLPLLLSAVILTVLIIRIFQFFARVCYILINPRASHE